ncbi:MAG TPA: AAA family ATPase [Vicinamibacterales bacterium]|jgi:general secretion pathway protein A
MREQTLRRDKETTAFRGAVPAGASPLGAAPRLAPPLSDQLGSWEKFYGFYRRPFSLTPDLRFAFNSRSHAHAFQQVTQALKRREGLIVVTGDIGTGKTMLCRSLLETFEARTFLCVVLDPALTVDELLRQVLTDFGLLSRSAAAAGVEPAMASRHQLVSALQRFLASLVPLNAHAVVMIDEAQQLQTDVLEQIRLLSNFETDEAKLLQIVLVGQPDLDALLQRDDMRQLNQRVARRCDLHPLSADEVGEYIGRRLAVAAEPPPGVAFISNDVTGPARPAVEFDPAALAAIGGLSRGIPRVVNTICDRALEIGHQRQARTLDAEIVAAAAEQLKLTPPRPIVQPAAAAETPAAVATERAVSRPFDRRLAIAAGLVAAAGVVWFALARGSQSGAPPAAPPVAATAAAAVNTPPIAQAPTPAAAPPSAATTAPAAVAASGETFHITVAAFHTDQRASAVAASLKELGLPMYTRLDPTSEWRLVIAGPFKSNADAAAAQRTLTAEGFTDTRVVSDNQ